MDIGKLYETLTGEPYPHAQERFVEASWALANRAGVLRDLTVDHEASMDRRPARSRRARPTAS
jgi:hypothetical protein